MLAFCKEFKVEYESVNFGYDGQIIKPNETPESVKKSLNHIVLCSLQTFFVFKQVNLFEGHIIDVVPRALRYPVANLVPIVPLITSPGSIRSGALTISMAGPTLNDPHFVASTVIH